MVLAVFLKSKYGQNQILQKVAGTVQTGIILKDLAGINVPIFSDVRQSHIREMAKAAFDNHIKSGMFYARAENLLLEELGLKEFKPDESLSHIVNLSDVKLDHRADAEYFQPKYEKLIGALGKDIKFLGTIMERKNKRIKIVPYVDYNYIEISDVDVGSGEVIFNIIKGENLPDNAKLKIDGGELIVSKVRPTQGAVSVIPDEWNESFVASATFDSRETTAREANDGDILSYDH